MCCDHLAFLKALQNCRDASDPRDRRETELQRGSRRIIAVFVLKQWRTIRAAFIRYRGAASATQ